MDTPTPRRLGKADQAELLEQLARVAGHPGGIGEVGARLGVEVDAQLIRVVDVGAAHRPRVKRDRAHLGRPADDRHLGGADLIRRAP